MKYIYLTAILTTILCSCSITAKREANFKKANWIKAYKEYATYACICEITDDKIDELLIPKKDISFTVHKEILDGYIVHADSLGRRFARQIEPIQVDEHHDLYGYKPNLAECLSLYTSSKVDSIALESYKKYKKNIFE